MIVTEAVSLSAPSDPGDHYDFHKLRLDDTTLDLKIDPGVAARLDRDGFVPRVVGFRRAGDSWQLQVKRRTGEWATVLTSEAGATGWLSQKSPTLQRVDIDGNASPNVRLRRTGPTAPYLHMVELVGR